MRSALLFSAALAASKTLLPPSAGVAQDPPPEYGELRRGLRIDSVFSALDNTRSPGCAVGLLESGRLVFARGYGMADLDHGIANTPRTVFRTGSVSKQFTAAVVVLLAEEGSLSLDVGIRRYFPELPGIYGPVTVRHLLHHTSGIRDYLELMAMPGVGDEATCSEEDVVRLLAGQEANREVPRPQARPDRKARALSPEEAKAPTGEFHSPELNATYRIYLRDGDLTLTYTFRGSPVAGFQASSGRMEGATFGRR